MQNVDIRSASSGIALAALGAFVAIYAVLNYDLGTLSSMGGGMFPAALGAILFLLGLAIGIGGLVSREEMTLPIDAKALAVILGATGVFAATVGSFGIVPATILLVLVSARADGRLRFWQSALLALALAGFSVLIFRVTLGLRLPIIQFPGF